MAVALKCVLNVISAISALVAAGLWFQSARVKVSATQTENQRNEDGTFPARIIANDSDFIATAFEQVRWSRWAALAAGIAALWQAVVTMI